jgi:hypothetical protein
MPPEDAARHAGVPHPIFMQIEAGTCLISSLELDRLAYALGRDVREFVAEAFCEHLAPPYIHVDALARTEEVERLRASIATERELRSLERLVGGAPNPQVNGPHDRLLELAVIAFSQDEISRSKLREIAAMVGLAGSDLDKFVDDAGVDGAVSFASFRELVK